MAARFLFVSVFGTILFFNYGETGFLDGSNTRENPLDQFTYEALKVATKSVFESGAISARCTADNGIRLVAQVFEKLGVPIISCISSSEEVCKEIGSRTCGYADKVNTVGPFCIFC